MRKRTINYCFDRILWGVITLLPLILYVGTIFFYLIGHRVINQDLQELLGFLSFENIMTGVFGWFDFQPVSDSFLYQVFYDILCNFLFAFDGGDPSIIAWYCSYICTVEFLHILVDVVLLLPRICSKFLSKFKAEDC